MCLCEVILAKVSDVCAPSETMRHQLLSLLSAASGLMDYRDGVRKAHWLIPSPGSIVPESSSRCVVFLVLPGAMRRGVLQIYMCDEVLEECCTAQVVEMAPAMNLPEATRQAVFADAIKVCLIHKCSD